VVDRTGRAVRVVLSPGQAGDAPQAAELLVGLSARHVVADTAYDSRVIREQVQQSGGQACIPPNPTRKTPATFNRRRYRHRNVIERFFGRIKQFRRVATRYEKKAANFLGFVWLATILTTLK